MIVQPRSSDGSLLLLVAFLQRWADCQIWRSRSSPEYWKLSPSPNHSPKRL